MQLRVKMMPRGPSCAGGAAPDSATQLPPNFGCEECSSGFNLSASFPDSWVRGCCHPFLSGTRHAARQVRPRMLPPAEQLHWLDPRQAAVLSCRTLAASHNPHLHDCHPLWAIGAEHAASAVLLEADRHQG